MIPKEWPKQEHKHCETIDSKIKNTQEKPTLAVVNIGVKNEKKERNCIVSELD